MAAPGVPAPSGQLPRLIYSLYIICEAFECYCYCSSSKRKRIIDNGTLFSCFEIFNHAEFFIKVRVRNIMYARDYQLININI